MNIIDKAIFTISPKKAKERAVMRAQIETIETGRNMMKGLVTNSGYSNGGAAKNKTWTKGYRSTSGSAKRDIEENRKTLRERSRDLAMNAPIAAGAVGSTRTSCVGQGLRPKPTIDHEILGISREEARNIERKIKKEFSLWADSTYCDMADQNTFYELQQIAFADWLKNGEAFALVKYEEETANMPYTLRLQLISADRISTPGSVSGEYDGTDKTCKNGNKIINGIEVNPNGKVIAYHISSKFPGEYGTQKLEWTRVQKRGDITGNPNILQVYNAERAEQYRGVPYLAPVIQSIKQISRYTEAEIMAAIINSYFTLFITTETGNDMELGAYKGEYDDYADTEYDNDGNPIENAAQNYGQDDDDEVKIGPGLVNFLKTGEKVNPVESTHPSGGFGTFVSAMSEQVGAALEIAPEILFKKFSASFSASKGALNETWRSFGMRRNWFVTDFCKPVYELWMNEAVASGRITAPGYFNDPIVRAAYNNATWNGPAQGCLNPLQEVNAAVTRIKNGLSTHEDECAAMNGSDFEDNVRTLESENKLLKKALGEEEEKNGDN
jgi:lambda family phage portal protein